MVKNLISEIMIQRAAAFKTAPLIAAIESGYLKSGGPEFKTKKSFSPSTLVYGHGACPRYWYLAFNGATYVPNSDADPKGIASMSNGTAGHERLQRAMANAGVLKEAEVRVEQTDPPIFGFCDGIIEWQGKEYPIEIKTMREESFAYRQANNNAADYHKAQLLYYMREKGYDEGLVIYENKNSHELLIVPVQMDDAAKKYLDDAYVWMRKVRASWEKKEIPKKPYRSNSKVCKGCPLQQTCEKSKAGTVDLGKLEMLV